MRVQYVAGYGRSGSTTLGRLLANRDGSTAVGEVSALARRSFVERALCSCGRTYFTCPYWVRFDERLDDATTGSAMPPIGHFEGLAGLLVPMPLLKKVVRRRSVMDLHPQVTYAAAVTAFGEPGFVDTSKTTRLTANRPRLLRASGVDVELWVPWRKTSAVVASHRAAQRRRGGSGRLWRSYVAVVPARALSFAAAGWCALSLRTRLHRRSLEQTLAELDTAQVSNHLEHLIAGNRNRHQENTRNP